MGGCSININGLEKEETHKIWKDLDGGTGSILLLLTISGTLGSETISDLTSHVYDPREDSRLEKRYVSKLLSLLSKPHCIFFKNNSSRAYSGHLKI